METRRAGRAVLIGAFLAMSTGAAPPVPMFGQPDPVAGAPTTAPTRPPLVSRTYLPPQDVTDEQVGLALHRGAMFLQRAFRDGQLQLNDAGVHGNRYYGALNVQGIDALCVYALLDTGQATHEPWLSETAPFTRQMLDVLKRYKLDFTYHRSLRAAALAVYNRPEDFATLEDDTHWLVSASHGGAYSYTASLVPATTAFVTMGGSTPELNPSGPHAMGPAAGVGYASSDSPIVGGQETIDGKVVTITPRSGGFLNITDSSSGYVQFKNGGAAAWSTSAGPGLRPVATYTPVSNTRDDYANVSPDAGFAGWDNSNSQFGLLGVWAGAEAGVAVPTDYWNQVQQHWRSCQLPSDAWGYFASDGPRISMTDAGLASLLVCSDYLSDTSLSSRTGETAINRALDLLDTGDNGVTGLTNYGWMGYSLYSLQRVGLASGFKFFGKHDWYAQFAKALIDSQHPDGSWGPNTIGSETAIDTAFSLLFLAGARHPVLFNKLRFDGDWNDYPRDVANLCKFATYELQRPVNWQVVNTASDWWNWMDSPVLYIATDERPHFSTADLNQLRSFALAGGLIFTQADGDNSAVSAWASQLAHDLFPGLPLRRLPAEHPVFSSLYDLHSPPPNLLGVSNGARLLMVHSPRDLAKDWQHQWTDAGKADYQLALNLFVYANGRTALHNRLQSPYIPPAASGVKRAIDVARLRYVGGWDPEPYAWKRFRNYFQWEAHSDLKVVDVPLPQLKPRAAVIAVLTGAVRQTFTAADVQAVRAYVDAGGVLLVDACGGSPDFVDSVERALLSPAFPGAVWKSVDSTDAFLRPERPGADDLAVPMLRPYAKELARGDDVSKLRCLSDGNGVVILSPLDLTSGLLGTDTLGINGYDPVYAAALVKNIVLWADARATPPTSSPATQPLPPRQVH